LISATLDGAKPAARVHRANLANARLIGAQLTGANFSDANLQSSSLRDSDLSAASTAQIRFKFERGADLSRANLRNADFTNSRMGFTTLDNVDLSSNKGLELISHTGLRKSASLQFIVRTAKYRPFFFVVLAFLKVSCLQHEVLSPGKKAAEEGAHNH